MDRPNDDRQLGERYPSSELQRLFFQQVLRELRSEKVEAFLVGHYGQEQYERTKAMIELFV